MGKSRKRRRRQKSTGQAPAVSPLPAPEPPPAATHEDPRTNRQVDRLLAAGKVKPAIAAAKAAHKKNPCPENERQAARAYVARTREMLDRGQVREAMDMIDMVHGRFPAGRDELLEVRVLAALTGGEGGESLPPDHPLRVQMAALAQAFAEVTQGPVSQDDVMLLQVPRSSPLASWKRLVRAIAYFQAGRDSLCRRSLAGIEPGTAPARAAAVMETMMSGESMPHRDKAAAALAGKVLPASAHHLPDLLEELEKALEEGPAAHIRATLRRAFAACGNDSPALLPELQRRALVRAVLAGIAMEQLLRHLAAPLKTDRSFWLLAARAAEQAGMNVCALLYWERALDFYPPGARSRREEGECAAILKRMVGLARHSSAEVADRDYFAAKLAGRLKRPEVQQIFWPEDGEEQPDLLARSLTLADPSALYHRWGEATLDSSVFEEWLAWERTESGENWRRCDPVAETWHRTLPRDAAPLLHLARSAEQRGAFSTALKWLEEARRVQAPDADLQEAHVRLVVAKTCRHLKQKKLHLAEADVEELKALPQIEEGDRPALPELLRWAVLVRAGYLKAAEPAAARLADLLGGPAAADLLCAGVAKAAGEQQVAQDLRQKAGDQPAARTIVSALDRIHLLCTQSGIEVVLPSEWAAQLTAYCNNSRPQLSGRSIRLLANLALQSAEMELLHAASGAGLRREEDTARYLYYRGRSMPVIAKQRIFTCWRLAAFLARMEEDRALLDEMQAGLRRVPYSIRYRLLPLFRTTAALASNQEVAEVVETEAGTIDYPRNWWDDFRDGPYGERGAPCDCANCRRARGESLDDEDDDGYWDDDEEEDYDDEDYDDEDYDDDDKDPTYTYAGERVSTPSPSRRERARQERKRKKQALKMGGKKRRK